MSDAKVTVVIPTYNKEKFIEQTLKSIHEQTLKNSKILIVDDASTDRTVEIAKKIAPNATLIVNKENKGICHVLNKALEKIDTKYFVQVDGDDWLHPKAIELLYEKMESLDTSTALAYADSSIWIHKNGVDTFKNIIKRPIFHDRYEFVTYFGMVQPRFYRTECVKKVGGWEVNGDPSNGRMLEDRRMLLRLLDDYTFTYVDQALYNIRYDGNNLASDKNAPTYNKLIKYFTDQALIRWGGKYRADYIIKGGWYTVKLYPTHK